MKKSAIIKEIAIHIINLCDIKKMQEVLCPLIYEVLAYGKQIPKGTYYLIPDRRYHDQFPVVYGFKFAFSKLGEPPFYITMSMINAAASKLTLPIIGRHVYADLILHAGIIDFFEKHPGLLDLEKE